MFKCTFRKEKSKDLKETTTSPLAVGVEHNYQTCKACGAQVKKGFVCEYCGTNILPPSLFTGTPHSFSEYKIRGDMNKITFKHDNKAATKINKTIRGDMMHVIICIGDQLKLNVKGDMNNILIEKDIILYDSDIKGDFNQILR